MAKVSVKSICGPVH